MPQQQGIDVKQTSGITCIKCGCPTFNGVFILRKASRFVTGAPEDLVIPAPVMTCTNCGVICTEALDPNIRPLFEAPIAEEPDEDPQPETGAKIIKMYP
jgi:hypothetical protein